MSTGDQSKRLQLAREHAGYKSARMASMRMGWKYPTYAAHESGGRNLTAAAAARYARAFDVHAEFLMFGSRKPDWYSEIAEPMDNISVPAKFMRMFKGEPTREIERFLAQQMDNSRQYVIADSGHALPGAFAMTVTSTEMCSSTPVPGEVPIHPGDVVIINRFTGDPIIPGSIMLVAVAGPLTDDRPSLRRVRSLGGGKFEYIATNQDYAPLPDYAVRPIGRVCIHIRHI